MSILMSLCSAFLMYTRIPFPKIEWKEENHRYVLCFFPLIGAVIGGFIILWYKLCGILNIDNILFASGCTIIPIFITGGIHIDGFCDTNDAIASCSNREMMLKIMKDSNIGAFAVIRLSVYILLQTAIFSEMRSMPMFMIGMFCFVQSRSWSGIAAVAFKNARNNNESLQSFSKPAYKTITITCELLWIISSSVAMLLLNEIIGTFTVLSGIAMFEFYYFFSKMKFNGITGDTEGWFLQTCEIVQLLTAVISFKLILM